MHTVARKKRKLKYILNSRFYFVEEERQDFDMSIICTNVENSPYLKKIVCDKRPGFVRATMDPATNQLPFPADYKYFSCFPPRKYAEWAQRIQNFKVRPDDIWVVGFPKTGDNFVHTFFPISTEISGIIDNFRNDMDAKHCASIENKEP